MEIHRVQNQKIHGKRHLCLYYMPDLQRQCSSKGGKMIFEILLLTVAIIIGLMILLYLTEKYLM